MSGYQVGPETFVTLSCQVFDAEGESASNAEVSAFVFGMGSLLPSVEEALEGHVAGETVEVVLPPERAYGGRDPQGILEVDRSEFPESVAPGDRFEVENDAGGLLVVHILDVQDDLVVVDTNHPLSGQEIKFRLEIQDVRPASKEEIEAAEANLAEDIEYLEADVPDITPGSLIRGAPRG
jgi:FKBP-type peptidyl-prolyl cis-trans isomerase SlyD